MSRHKRAADDRLVSSVKQPILAGQDRPRKRWSVPRRAIITSRMLQELVVENYAVVDRLRIRFHPGLNLLTGETGGGKSIVVDALGLLLGARASAEMIRTGESRAHVAGIFDVRDSQPIRRLLETAGIESDDGELLVEREILAGGKSRAFVGSRPVAVSLLKDLAPFLADIHGQHDQQLLFSPEAQRDMLDAFAAHRDSLDRAAAVVLPTPPEPQHTMMRFRRSSISASMSSRGGVAFCIRRLPGLPARHPAFTD